jgi:hypothetical protein
MRAVGACALSRLFSNLGQWLTSLENIHKFISWLGKSPLRVGRLFPAPQLNWMLSYTGERLKEELFSVARL